MPTTRTESDKRRREAPRTANTSGDSEPRVPDHDPADLDDDNADSGPDRDRRDLDA
jgi:hypothetical protein